MLSACASLQQPSETDATPVATAKKPTLVKTSPARKGQAKAEALPEDPLPTPALSDEILFKVLSSEIAFQRGQWQAAYVTLLGAAQQTRDPRLAKRAAEMAIAARRPNEALAAVRLWTELAPHSDEALQSYLALIMLGDNISEIQPLMAQRLAEASPQARGPLILQIQRLLIRAKDKAVVFNILQDIVAPYPTLVETHLALARSAYANRDPERARDEAKQALKLKPDSELAILTLAEVTPDGNEAAKLVSDFLKKYPNAREVRIAYARGLAEQKQYEQAIRQFQTLLKEDPEDATTLFALGILNVQISHFPEAETYLKRYLAVLAAQPDDERDPTQALLVLSQIAEDRNDIPAALSYLEQVEPGESYAGVQVRRAQLMAKGGDIDGARKILQQAQSDAGSDREVLQFIQAEGQLLRDSERYQDASDVLSAGLKRFPDSTDLLYDYAMVTDKTGNYKDMETSLRKIIEIAPNNQHAYNALGYSLADRNIRLPEAVTLIKKAVQLAPEDPFIADSLGWAEFRMGNLDEAEKELRRAYGLRPDPEIGIHLGEILWARGKQDEAKKLWREAQSKDPKNDVLKSTLERLKVQL
nr:tetratricopeptide repeat protein [Herbaspirillum sp. CF444]